MSNDKKEWVAPEVRKVELVRPFTKVGENGQQLKSPFKIIDTLPEDMEYLILYEELTDGENIKYYEVVKGRKAAYDFIKSIIDLIDIEESKVVSEVMTFKEASNVKEFMIIMKNHFPEDPFDISDYIVE